MVSPTRRSSSCHSGPCSSYLWGSRGGGGGRETGGGKVGQWAGGGGHPRLWCEGHARCLGLRRATRPRHGAAAMQRRAQRPGRGARLYDWVGVPALGVAEAGDVGAGVVEGRLLQRSVCASTGAAGATRWAGLAWRRGAACSAAPVGPNAAVGAGRPPCFVDVIQISITIAMPESRRPLQYHSVADAPPPHPPVAVAQHVVPVVAHHHINCLEDQLYGFRTGCVGGGRGVCAPTAPGGERQRVSGGFRRGGRGRAGAAERRAAPLGEAPPG